MTRMIIIMMIIVIMMMVIKIMMMMMIVVIMVVMMVMDVYISTSKSTHYIYNLPLLPGRFIHMEYIR